MVVDMLWIWDCYRCVENWLTWTWKCLCTSLCRRHGYPLVHIGTSCYIMIGMFSQLGIVSPIVMLVFRVVIKGKFWRGAFKLLMRHKDPTKATSPFWEIFVRGKWRWTSTWILCTIRNRRSQVWGYRLPSELDFIQAEKAMLTVGQGGSTTCLMTWQ